MRINAKGGHSTEKKQENPNYLSRVQVANLLGVHPHSVDAYAKAGLFPKYRIGRHVRFKYDEVVNAVENSKTWVQ